MFKVLTSGPVCTSCSIMRRMMGSLVGLDPVSPTLKVPPHIKAPPYAKNGIPALRTNSIDLKGKDEIKRLRVAGELAGWVLDRTLDIVAEGMTTDELDKFVHSLIIKEQAYPAPLNYRGYPKSVCTSVNNVLCHGIPNSRELEEGDVISIDVSLYRDGVYGDCCSTVIVGEGDPVSLQLVSVTEQCLLNSIKECRPGASFSAIGKCISKDISKTKFSICKEFIGHGIGTYFHGAPEVYHYTNSHGPIMRNGMVFTIEPIIMEGRDAIAILSDGWTAVSQDDKRSAQFEHMILITDDGAEILTPHR